MPKFRNIRIKKPGGGTRIQRAQVLKSGKLKFVKNIKRGGKKAAKKAPARKRAAPRKAPAKRRKSVAKKGNPSNKSPKIGAAIQGFKSTVTLASPAIDAGARHGLNQQALTALRGKANLSLAGNVAMTGVNRIVDRKIAHGAALSRGSVTAWLTEGYAALRVADEIKGKDGRGAILSMNHKLASMINGYRPSAPAGGLDFTDPDFRMYQGLKIVGGGVRRLSNVGPFKGITAPAKKFLGELGGAL